MDYWARGPPRRVQTAFTTYGYELQLVRQRGGHYTQEPRPRSTYADRPRSDACLIRPSRSLSVSQIMAGEYFARPDPDAFVRILRQQHEAASKGKKPATLPPLAAEPMFDASAICDGLGGTEPSVAGDATLLAESQLSLAKD